MQLKYIAPVIISFGLVFIFTYGASALYEETNSIENYYENKSDQSYSKYEKLLYEREVREIKKLQQKIAIEKKKKEERQRKRQEAIQKEQKLKKQRIAKIAANNKRAQSQATARARQKKIDQQNAAIAAEKARLKKITVQKKVIPVVKKKSRSSRAS